MKITIIIASIVFLSGAAYIGWWHQARVEVATYEDWLARATPTEVEVSRRYPFYTTSAKIMGVDYMLVGDGRMFVQSVNHFNVFAIVQILYGVMACLGSGLFLIGMYFGRRSKAS